MSLFTCDLCRKTDLRREDRLLIRGKCEAEIIFELESLSRSPNTDYICRRCYQLIKKRRNLIKNISSIESNFVNARPNENTGSFDCDLCSSKSLKTQERYLVNGKGKFDIRAELRNLFRRKRSDYICRTCFRQLKKRKKLLEDLNCIQFEFQNHARAITVVLGGVKRGYEKPCEKTSQQTCLVTTLVTPTKKQKISDCPSVSTPWRNDNRCGASSLHWPVSPVKFQRNEQESYAEHVDSVDIGPTEHEGEVENVEVVLIQQQNQINIVESNIQNCQVKNVELSEQSHLESDNQPSNTCNTQENESGKVSIEIDWPSKTVKKNLSGELYSLGKFLAIGTYKQIARAAWKIPGIKKELCNLFTKEVQKETADMCSKKQPSILRKNDKDSMNSLSIEKVSQEIETRAPLFHSVLKASSTNNFSVNRGCKSAKSDDFAAVTTAGSICLRNRCKNMNAIQLLITTFIYHSSWI